MLLTILAFLAAQGEPEALRVGTYGYPGVDRSAALQPLADLVERESGRPVQVVLLPTPGDLSKAICDGAIDVAMTNLGAFVEAGDCARIQPVAVLDAPAAVLARYRGILITRRDKHIAKLAALKAHAPGLRYSEVLPGSASGALVQADALRTLGLSPSDFKELRQSGTHEGALEDLLEGRSDIVAMAEEPWKKMQANRPAAAAGLRVLWRSKPLPVGPVVCRNSAILRCDALTAALLGPTGRKIATTLSGGWTETEGATGFRAYRQAEYAPFRTGASSLAQHASD